MFAELREKVVAIPQHWPQVARVKHVLYVLYEDTQRVNLFSRASAMAYTTLGSIVPSLAAIFAIISVFAPLTNPEASWFEDFRVYILQVLAPDTGAKIVENLERLLANVDTAMIGTGSFIGLLAILILLLRNIEMVLNEIWQVPNPRSPIRRFIFFWSFLTLGAVILSVTLGYLTRFEIENLIPFWNQGEETNLPGAFLATLLMPLLFFTVIYKIGPNTIVNIKSAVVGAITATVLIRTVSFVYGLYAANNVTYKTIYGALSAIPFFLLWLYLGWVVILFGVVVSWRYQQGIPEASEGQEKTENPIEHERRLQVRALMPFLTTLAVYAAFQRGTGEGVKGRALARELGVPAEWVAEGLRACVSAGYVTLAYPLDADPDLSPSDVLELPAYPAYPADAVEPLDVLRRLTRESLDWFDRQTSEPIAVVKRYLDLLFPQTKEAFSERARMSDLFPPKNRS